MPTPPRTSLDAIVNEARRILEADGLESLTMQRVADAVGVRAPSLYKHVRSRDALIRLVAQDALADLGVRFEAAAGSGDPRRDLAAMAHTLRAFAHDVPQTYRLLWFPRSDDWRVEPGLNARAAEPLLRVSAELAEETHALEAARTFTAWAHGFISMELAGAFRLGGDIDEAFDYGLARLVGAVARGRPSG